MCTQQSREILSIIWLRNLIRISITPDPPQYSAAAAAVVVLV